MKIKTSINTAAILRARGLGGSTGARRKLAAIVARHCDPYVPMQQGTLKNTVQIAEDGAEIRYNQPYAHYQYYGEVMAGRAPKHYTGDALDHHGAPTRGREWDKRMMADRGGEVVDDFAQAIGGRRK